MSVATVFSSKNASKYLKEKNYILLAENTILHKPVFWFLRGFLWRYYVRLITKFDFTYRLPIFGNIHNVLKYIDISGKNKQLLNIALNQSDFIHSLVYNPLLLLKSNESIGLAYCDDHVLINAKNILKRIHNSIIICIFDSDTLNDYPNKAKQHILYLLKKLELIYPDRVFLFNEKHEKIFPRITSKNSQGFNKLIIMSLLNFSNAKYNLYLVFVTCKNIIYKIYNSIFEKEKKLIKTFQKTDRQKFHAISCIDERFEESDIKKNINEAIKTVLSFETTFTDCVIAIAFSGRHQIVDVSLRLLQNYKKNLNLHIVIVGSGSSDDEYGHVVSQQYPNVSYFSFNNEPLGAKWQFAVECAKLFNPKYLVILGSDDLLGTSFLNHIINICSEKEDFINSDIAMWGLVSWYVFNCNYTSSNNGILFKVNYTDHQYTIGSGRIYSRKFLNSINWELFDVTFKKWLDNKGEDKLMDLSEKREILFNAALVSIKGEWFTINPIEDIVSSADIDVIPLDFNRFKIIENEFPGLLSILDEMSLYKIPMKSKVCLINDIA